MPKLLFEVATPERLVISEQVDDVILPSVEGYMGVMAGHAPLLAQLDVGEIAYAVDGKKKYLSVTGGFVEVLRESVQVLARASEPAEEIDLERAKQRAEQKLGADLPADESRHLEVKLKRAVARISVSTKAGG